MKIKKYLGLLLGIMQTFKSSAVLDTKTVETIEQNLSQIITHSKEVLAKNTAARLAREKARADRAKIEAEQAENDHLKNLIAASEEEEKNSPKL
jgi:hypothetical protein